MRVELLRDERRRDRATAARMLSSVSSSSRSGPPVDASRCSCVIGGDVNQLNGPIESSPL